MKQNQRKSLDESEYLVALSATLDRLMSSSGPSQQEIEAATGVDQTTMSRAKNGKLRRVTEKVRRLKHYADTLYRYLARFQSDEMVPPG